MIRIAIPWRDRQRAAAFSIELSRWCCEQGLVDRVDYNWQFKPNHNETVFYFEDSAESYATLFQLKWAGHEF